MYKTCGCFIIPKDVLDRLANDKSLSEAARKALNDTRAGEDIWRRLRTAHAFATNATMASRGLSATLATSPKVSVFTCNQTTSLPGTPVANPGSSADMTAKRTFDLTTEVAKFYKSAFGRNSIDDAGMTMISSIHYDENYNNAFWDGNQMTYGDGDGEIFVDFTKSDDVIAHELTHGVTQYTTALNYQNQAGGLNESISDVFGSMFRQWMAGQDVTAADWLIGSEIMGPAATARGFSCLRDMAYPGAAHCLAPQPQNYSNYRPGSDPHESSGIPNHAFYLAAMALGGKSWEQLGKVWYGAMTTGRPSPGMRFRTFANRTCRAARTLFPGEPNVLASVKAGWAGVGL